MRWGYLLPRVLIVGLVWAFFAYAFDPLMRRTLVYGAQKAARAKVDVARVQTTFFPPSVEMRHVAVAKRKNPWKNLVEFDSFRFRLAGRPLLRKSFVIEEGTLTGVQWDTKRETSGELPDEPKSEDEGPGFLGKLGDKASELGQDWVADLKQRTKMQLDHKQLESVKLVDTLETEWTTRFADYERQVKSLETRFKQLKTNVEKARGNVLQKFEAYRQATFEAQRLLAEADRIRRELATLPQVAQNDYRRVDAARLRDQALLKKKLEFFKLDARHLTDSLLGPQLKQRIAEAVDWMKWTKENVGKLMAGGPTPERYRGVDVSFPRTKPLPAFVVHKLHVSGQAELGKETMPFSGTVTNITSDPVLHGKPVVVELSGKAKAAVQLTAVLDYTRPQAVHRLAVAYDLPEETRMTLGSDKKLEFQIAAGRTRWQCNLLLVGDNLTGNVKLRQDPIRVVDSTQPTDPDGKPKTEDELRRILAEALAGVTNFEATLALTGTYKDPQWELQSNLGPQLSDSVNRVVARELAAKQAELTARLNRLVDDKTAAFTNKLNGRYGEVLSLLNVQELSVKQLIQQVAARPADKLNLGGRKLDLNRLLRR